MVLSGMLLGYTESNGVGNLSWHNRSRQCGGVRGPPRGRGREQWGIKVNWAQAGEIATKGLGVQQRWVVGINNRVRPGASSEQVQGGKAERGPVPFKTGGKNNGEPGTGNAGGEQLSGESPTLHNCWAGKKTALLVHPTASNTTIKGEPIMGNSNWAVWVGVHAHNKGRHQVGSWRGSVQGGKVQPTHWVRHR